MRAEEQNMLLVANPIGTPPAGVVPVMLKIAVKRRPLVGLGVLGLPSSEVAASSMVLILSAPLQFDP